MRDYEFYYTQDGSVGLYSYADDDVYHSKFGALTEAWEKFVIPSDIHKKLNQQEYIKVLDVCYGIGYNTKAFMSFVINNNEKFFKKKKNNFIKNFLKNLKQKNKKKKSKETNNIDTIDSNNNKDLTRRLSLSIESDYTKISNVDLSKIKIDCLEINSELVKISPLLKTIITPQEIFCRIVPNIFDCFETYWKIRKFLSKLALKLAPKNKRKITELLDLKFNNDYEELNKDYRIHKFVNYILVDSLLDKYKGAYIDKDLKNILADRKVKRFFDKATLNYALFKQNKGYKLISKVNLLAFLHNIYYDHLSNRYKKINYEDISKLFNLNFYVSDARKSILSINEQYDLMFLDAFTFSKAPELWTVEFMAELYRRLSPTGILMTYSNSALVRNTFLENNFYIGKIVDPNTGKCIGTIAAKEKSIITNPLSNYELGLCSTKAGIPYRDPRLTSTKEEILKRREIEFKESDLMTSSQYMRARGAKINDGNG